MSFISDLEDLVNRFGDWVAGLFNNAEKLYQKLTLAEQQAATWGYGIIAILNKLADDVPAALAEIGIKYPEISPDVLHGFLDIVIKDAGIVVGETPLTLEEAATKLATYLGSLKGQAWQTISQNMGNLLAILFSPTTPVQKFIGVAEYVYRAIVKPHVEATN